MKFALTVSLLALTVCLKAQNLRSFGGITFATHFNTHTTAQLSYMRGWAVDISDSGKSNVVLLLADAGFEFTTKDFFAGPKVSFKSIWLNKFSVGGEVIRYARPEQQQWIFRPQIGLTWSGIAEVAYGYNFYESGGTLDKKYLAPSHIISLYLRVSPLLFLAKLYSAPQPKTLPHN